MPNRPKLLSAETSRYSLEITELDDGTFELSHTDWDRECGDSTTHETVSEAQEAALKLTGESSIVWKSPPPPEIDASA